MQWRLFPVEKCSQKEVSCTPPITTTWTDVSPSPDVRCCLMKPLPLPFTSRLIQVLRCLGECYRDRICFSNSDRESARACRGLVVMMKFTSRFVLTSEYCHTFKHLGWLGSVISQVDFPGIVEGDFWQSWLVLCFQQCDVSMLAALATFAFQAKSARVLPYKPWFSTAFLFCIQYVFCFFYWLAHLEEAADEQIIES